MSTASKIEWTGITMSEIITTAGLPPHFRAGAARVTPIPR